MVTPESGDRVGAFTELLDRAEGQYGRVRLGWVSSEILGFLGEVQ